MTTATLPRPHEWQRDKDPAANREMTVAPIGEDTLDNRPDLIAELERHLSAAGMLGSSRSRRKLWTHIKSIASLLS